MKTFLKMGMAAALVAAPAYAQTGSQSDIAGPIAGSIVVFAPLPGAVGATSTGLSLGITGIATVNGIATSFTAGGAITSPITGGPIPPAALNTVGQIISGGPGASAAVTSVSAALSAIAPGQTGLVAQLTVALTTLSTSTPETARANIIAAAALFNQLVTALPPGSLNATSLSPTLLAVHAALSPSVAAVR
jgi:hypothetical protein